MKCEAAAAIRVTSTGGSWPVVPSNKDGRVGPWPVTLSAVFRGNICVCVCVFTSEPWFVGYLSHKFKRTVQKWFRISLD